MALRWAVALRRALLSSASANETNVSSGRLGALVRLARGDWARQSAAFKVANLVALSLDIAGSVDLLTGGVILSTAENLLQFAYMGRAIAPVQSLFEWIAQVALPLEPLFIVDYLRTERSFEVLRPLIVQEPEIRAGAHGRGRGSGRDRLRGRSNCLDAPAVRRSARQAPLGSEDATLHPSLAPSSHQIRGGALHSSALTFTTTTRTRPRGAASGTSASG